MTSIAIDSILAAPFQRRPVDQNKVASLADSIKTLGLLNAITVTAIEALPGKYHLVAGAHRLQSAQTLGWTEIPANVVDLDALHTELAIIDENLLRNELSTMERGEQFARRKAIYEELHPETRPVNERGGPGRGKTNETISSVSTPTFAEDTAAKAGVSVRTVEQEVQIATNLAPDVKDQIRDTPLADNKTALLEMAREEPQVQRGAMEVLASEDKPTTERVRQAIQAVKEPKKKDKPTPRPAVTPNKINVALRGTEVFRLCIDRAMESFFGRYGSKHFDEKNLASLNWRLNYIKKACEKHLAEISAELERRKE